ncbi:MAG: response regulator [Anaerolineae bacterium]|nr:response regulator [Anaerolineae bacterium]MCA9891803.1 response regulator [Anaerolineae bacterium]MCB9461763.1 response regulator [Anaerolineaceae bacterium]
MSKVMIVDDDRTTVMLLQTLLELDGFDVTIVPNGSAVIATVEHSLPDVILMDYHLTDMYGVEVLRDLRAHPAFGQIPVIITSGMDVSDEAMDAGANEFLVKPFEPGDLPALFNKHIAK